MNPLLRIAADEWRYWLRSHLAVGGVLVFFVLIATSSVLTTLSINAQTHERLHQQSEAEQTFLSQPDRHPHRMVHYGHYVFRAPTPLAIFDPGLDSVTGQSIFLEGHRQNTASFSESSASANLGGLSYLTPALMYQLFGALIMILLGHGAVVRERESRTLTPLLSLGVTGTTLLMGKALALLMFTLIILLPLVVTCLISLNAGETPLAVLLLFTVYFIYLFLWALVTLLFSAIARKRGTALAILTGLWFVSTLVLPSVAVNVATKSVNVAGKIETDLAMLNDLRELGDGHNAGDPAFATLRANLLKKYNVEKVEDLPINFRGLVAMEGEKKLTKVLNDYAQARMDAEARQEQFLARLGFISPSLAISLASRSIAGTDLLHYHRFQVEAENLRYSFVQGLNRAHAQELSYQDDINRNKDEESWRRARVDADAWQVLDTYQFNSANLSERFVNARFSIGILGAWLFGISCVLIGCSRRLKP